MFRQIFFSFVVIVSLGCGSVYAETSVHGFLSPEEKAALMEAIHAHAVQCAEENGISAEKIVEMHKNGNAVDIEPCFVSCLQKKLGIFTSNGMFDADKFVELITPYIKCPKKLAIINEATHTCTKVNDEEVSDGDKGCERVKLLHDCIMEYKKQMKLDQPDKS